MRFYIRRVKVDKNFKSLRTNSLIDHVAKKISRNRKRTQFYKCNKSLRTGVLNFQKLKGFKYFLKFKEYLYPVCQAFHH